MKRLYAFCSLTFCISVSFAQTVVYVNASASGANNGTSWQNAYRNLVDAVAGATANSEIWVSNTASYKVARNEFNGERVIINKNLSLYGGFAGTETNKNQRITGSKTILTGEIGSASSIADNSYNAFVVQAAVSFDDFLFSSFNSNYDNLAYYGVIVADSNSKAELSNVVFTGNEGRSQGVCISAMKGAVVNARNVTANENGKQSSGALFGHMDDATLRFEGCTFTSNGKDGGSGSGYIFYAYRTNIQSLALNKKVVLDVHNSNFSGNTLDINYSYFGSNSFRKCAFTLAGGGGNIFDQSGDSSSFVIDSCSITGKYGAPLIYVSGHSLVQFSNSSFDNPYNEANYFFNFDAARIRLENSTFNNVRGSIPLYIGNKGAETVIKNTSFLGGEVSSYLLYVTGKKAILESSQFINIKTAIGTYFDVDSGRFSNCVFSKLPGYNPFVPFDYIKAALIENCEFSEMGPSQPLFRVMDGNLLMIKNSFIKDVVMAQYNPGAPLLFANWGSKLVSINNRFEHVHASGYLADNTGETLLFGNIFEDVDAPNAFYKNSASLSVYNCNFADLDLPLFLNDSSYNQGKTIHFTLVNSVVYNNSDTLVLTNAAPSGYVQDISNCYSNKTLPGSNNTNQSKVPYSDVSSSASFAGLQDKGRNLSSLPELPAIDILGNPRIKFGAIDIGAIEFQGTLAALENNVLFESGFNCYPNPAKDLLWIESEEPTSLELFNIKGLKVLTKTIPSGKSLLSIEMLESGLYILALKSKAAQKQVKIVKQ